MKNRLYLSIFCLLFMMACNSSSQENSSEAGTPTQETSDPLSKVTLKDLEGKPIDLDAYAGKTIVLNFWATWCKPCIIEMPSMVEAKSSLGDDFVFLLASDESIEKISKFTGQQQIDLPFVQLQTGVQNLQITALPTTWVIKDGEVVHEFVGAREWNKDEHLQELRSL